MKGISLIVYDFDGVMTDNRVLISENGKEAVFVNRSDGMAVKLIKGMGIRQMIISAEANPVVKARARKLGIPFIQAVENKKQALAAYLSRHRIDRVKVVFVGNDINDKEAMKFVGMPVAVADASREIRKIAKIILSSKGGHGVVRELLTHINSTGRSI